jgi:hypothetical protein
MYMHFDAADLCLVVPPKNYPHTRGQWNPYKFGVEQLQGCLTYGFGDKLVLERILLMGYESFDTQTNEPHSVQTRKAMRADAEAAGTA